MRVADIIADFLYQKNVDSVFLVTGGGMMFLTDGLACKQEIKKISCHHEQAAAMAAVAYAKHRGIGAAFVTTGCGGTNTVTGVLHAWQDNVPCFFISGQCNTYEMMSSKDTSLRQFGVQEANIIPIVNSITKYAVTIMNPSDILYELEKAYYYAKSGRPGPVWLDIPMDVQEAEVDHINLKHFIPEEDYREISDKSLILIKEYFEKSERPVVLIGQGVRLSGATDQLKELINKYKIPCVCTKLGIDIIPSINPLNMGEIGTRGTRTGNLTIQNSDFILVLGSRLAAVATGYNFDLFARNAKVIVVDIDENEHKKNTVSIDIFVNADIKKFLDKLDLGTKCVDEFWINKCFKWKSKYPVCSDEHYNDDNGISMYAFMDVLCSKMAENAVVVTDAGSTAYVPAQVFKTYSTNQRYVGSGAQGEMGYALPGAVGACEANNRQETICITGDGSIQMNIQELQTIKHHNYPIKIFIWNNNGYVSIRGHQKGIFKGRFLGVDKESGLSLPDYEKISEAYGIRYMKSEKINDFREQLDDILSYPGPVICEVMCQQDELILAAVSNKRTPDGKKIPLPIEDMAPFLDRDEFYKEMIVEPIKW